MNNKQMTITIVGIIGVLIFIKMCFDSAHDARVQTANRMSITVNAGKSCKGIISPCEYIEEKKEVK